MAAGAGSRSARGVLSASRRRFLFSLLFSSFWACNLLSLAEECRESTLNTTVLFLQKKGPEVAVQEVNISSGLDTGLRESFFLHGAAVAGFVVDSQLQEVYVLPASPPVRMEKFNFTSGNQLEFVNSTTLRTSNALGSDTLLHIWNVISWENRGRLLAAVPSGSGFYTTILAVDAVTGLVSEQLSLAGAPIRGLYTFDRRTERYFFVTAQRDTRQIVIFYAAELRSTVSTFPNDAGFEDLVGIHYDEVDCRVVGLFLRAPGLLSAKELDVSQSVVSSMEFTALSPAVSLSVQAKQLIGATALVNGAAGTDVMVRDPLTSSVTVFRLGTNTRYTIAVEDDGIVSFAVRVQRVPTIESVSPKTAGMTGASLLTIIGSDFGHRDLNPVAYIGDTAATSVQWISDSSLTTNPVANGIAGVGFTVAVEVEGVAAVPDTFAVEYVPSWTRVVPTEASVAGGTVLTFTGGRFGQGSYECRFGSLSRVAATPSGSSTITCVAPAWPLPSGLVQLDILVDGVVMKRDTDGMLPFVAGNVTQITIGARPETALAGTFFETPFQVQVRDSAGNINFEDNRNIEIELFSKVNGVLSPANTTAITVQGPLLVGTSGGAANFTLSISQHGVYVLSFFSSPCRGANSSTPGCFRVNATLLVVSGDILIVRAPVRALAGLPMAPQPVVEVLDSRDEIANVSVVVRAHLDPPNPMARLVASDVTTVAGVASFTDISIAANGSYTIVFSVVGSLTPSPTSSNASGPTINTTVEILHSKPAYLFNAGGRPANTHTAMRPLSPPPTIWPLDAGGNRIVDTYWIQDSYGVVAERHLNLTVTAVLSSAFENRSSSFGRGDGRTLLPPYPLPSALTPPPNSGKLFSTVSIQILSDPTLQPSCPGLDLPPRCAQSNCAANASCSWNCSALECSGHGVCGAASTCNCSSAWQGDACWLPSDQALCGEECESYLGRWVDGECGCFPPNATAFQVAQYGNAAVFNHLLIDSQATGYVMYFTSDGLEPARSFAFSILSGQANHLYVIAQPMSGSGGAELTNTPVVEVRDAGRNIVTQDSAGANVTIYVTLVDSPPRANLSAIPPSRLDQRASGGFAVFAGLVVDLATVYAGREYRLQFSADGLIEAYSQPFQVDIGDPSYFVVLTQPADALGGEPFLVQPVLELRDAGNNRVNESSGWTVNASLEVLGNATLGGSLSASFQQGVAEFGNLEIDRFDSGYRILFAVPTLADVLSQPFSVTRGQVSALFLSAQPGNAIGGVLTQQPVLQLVDQGGNLITTNDRTIVVQLTQPSFPAPVLVGNYATISGEIYFTDLYVTSAGSFYQLIFSSAPFPDVYSLPFNNTLGAPFSTRIRDEPGNVIAGVVFTRQPTLELLDQGGNFVPASGVNVSVRVNGSALVELVAPFATTLPESNRNGSGCELHLVPPELFGTVSLLSSGGVIEFTDLTVNKAGSGYFLEFFSLQVAGTVTANFTVSLGEVAVSLHVFCQPTVEAGGEPFMQQPVIDLLDSGGNRIHAQTFLIRVMLQSSPAANATLSGVVSSVAYGDLSSFTNLAIDTAADGYILRFEAPGLASDETFGFRVIPGSPAAVIANEVPRTLPAGEPQVLDVSLADKGGNAVVNSSAVLTADLFEVLEEVRTYRCTGTHSCGVDLNASIPPGARLMAAILSIDIVCTDLDFQTEQVTSVSFGEYALVAGLEFDTGPWPGCFRDCSQSRPVISSFDLVREVCWDSKAEACDRMLYTNVWTGNGTRWDHLQTLTQQQTSAVPLTIHINEDVNFHPCDGNLLSADVQLRLQYALPASAGSFTGNTTAVMDGGIATFTDLLIYNSNTSYTLGFFSNTLSPAFLERLTIVPGPVRALLVSVQPGNGTGNTTLETQPVVLLVDNGNNTVLDASGSEYTVSAHLRTDNGTAAATPLLGTSVLESVRGQAAFTNLFVGAESAGFRYQFRFAVTVNGTAPVDSSEFSVSTGPPYSLYVATQPDGAIGGRPFLVQPIVYGGDWSANLVPYVTGIVTAQIGNNGGLTGVLSGLDQGVLSIASTEFVNLTIDKAGQGYTLVFALDGLVSAETVLFSVQKGNATQLAMRRQPSDGVVLRLLNTQPAVEVHDDGGNIITDWVGTINVSIGLQGSPIHPTLATNRTAVLSGTTTGLTFEGAGFFWNLKIDQMGLGFVLEFSAGTDIQNVSSSPFNIFGDTATSLRMLVQPRIARTSLRMAEIVVAAQDDNGDIDGAFLAPASAALLSSDGFTTARVFNTASIAFANGVARFDSVQVAEAAGQLKLNFSAAAFEVVSDTFDIIEAFTGWWNFSYDDEYVQMSMRRDPTSSKVTATWRDAGTSADVEYSATHDPELDVQNACMSVAGAMYSAGEGVASAYFQHCEQRSMTGLSADKVPTTLDTATLFAKDVQHVMIEEYYPVAQTAHYVLVANAFNSTSNSYTLDSVLYKWESGSFALHQTFPATKGANSWEYFQMGGANYLIVANHYDDGGNGYGVPSIIYQQQWDEGEQKQLFSAIQSISGAGAVVWKHFKIDGNDYLAVANYFNGSDYDIDSKVYQLERTDPDSLVPRTTPIQSIATSGARDVVYFEMNALHFLAFANRHGASVAIFQWSAATQQFVAFQAIITTAPMGVAAFEIGGVQYLAVANVGREFEGEPSSNSSLYKFESSSSNFVLAQDLPTAGASSVRALYNDGEQLLALTNIYNTSATNGTCDVYKWNGARFSPYFELPTIEAYSLTVFTAPCDTNNPGGPLCDGTSSERLIVAVNGFGSGSDVFRVSALNATSYATHVEVQRLERNGTQVGATIAPPVIARLMSFTEYVSSSPGLFDAVDGAWPQTIQADAVVSSYLSPTGLGGPKVAPVAGENSAIVDINGQITISNISATSSGNTSIRLFNDYLNDIAMSRTNEFLVAPAVGQQLQLQSHGSLLLSGNFLDITVSVHDAFGNLVADADGVTITARPFGNATVTLSSDTSVASVAGIATFSIQVEGNGRDVRIEFASSGLQGVVSGAFDVIATSAVSDLPGSELIFGGATITAVGEYVLLFGGLNESVASAAVVQLQTTTLPYSYVAINASGSVPAERYHHASTGIQMNGVPTLFVHGGTNGSAVLSDSFVLSTTSFAWIPVQTTSLTPRQRHGVVSGSILQDGAATVVSLVAAFGGLDQSGSALASLELYRVYLFSVQQVTSVVELGAPPSARHDFLMAWTSGKGFVLGGDGVQATELHSFEITFDGTQFTVQWAVHTPDHGSAAPPYRVLVNTPALFDSKIYLLATTSSSDTSSTLFGLDVDAFPTPQWLATSVAAGGLPPPQAIYQIVEVAEGKFVILQNDFTNLTTASRRLLASFTPLTIQLSLVRSERLLLDNTTYPSGGSAGFQLDPQPLIRVVDSVGATVTGVGSVASIYVTAFDALSNALTLGGNSAIQAQHGIAQFTDLSVDTNTSGAVLRFSSPALFAVDSPSFTVVRGPAAVLVMTTQPFGVFLGQTIFLQPAVELQDTSGNRVIEDSFSVVTASLQQFTPSGFIASDLLLGTVSVTLSSGVAQFADLAIRSDATTGINYKIVVSRAGVISAVSDPFTFTDASGTQILFNPLFSPNTGQCANQTVANAIGCRSLADASAATDTGVAMVPFSSQPSFTIVVSDTSLPFRHEPGLYFTASLITTTNDTAMHNAFYGNSTGESVDGVIVYTDLGIRRAGTNFVLRFESPGFPTLDSSAFTIIPGTPATLDVIQDAVDSEAGIALFRQPAIAVSDAGGNLVGVETRVTASLLRGHANRDLVGDVQAHTSAGIATFTDLTVDAAENGFFLQFSLTDGCCGALLFVNGSTFNITTSQPVQLAEVVTPAGGTGGIAFTTQPQVGVLDAGGNLITRDNGTEVTAFLFKDDTIRLAVKPSVRIANTDILDLEHFTVNGTDYVVAAMYFDQSTYAVQSVLYRWNPADEVIVPLQSIPTNGAAAWEYVEFNGEHYLFLANQFEEVSVSNGVILGTYITDSKVYEFAGETLVELASFQTEGATDIESFSVGGETFIAVANNFNDTSTAIQSVLYRFNASSPVKMTPIQALPTKAATVMHSFTTSAGTFLAICQFFSESSNTYVTQSQLHRFVGGQLELLTTFDTSGAVSIQTFSVDLRTFLAVANSVDSDGSLTGGSIDVYEFDGGALTLQQSILGLTGVTSMQNLYINDAQWLAVATNPIGESESSALILLSWDVSNCSTTEICGVNFTTFETLRIADCRSVTHFRRDSNNYIIYGGNSGLDAVSFQSSARLLGTRTAYTVNGLAKFTDLALDLVQSDFVLSYESAGLFTAVGDSFAVVAGPPDSLALQQSPATALGGAAFATQPIVGLVDAGGNVIESFAGVVYVNANVSSAGRPSELRGTTSVQLQQGLAIFTDLGITTSTWNVLLFHASGYSGTDVNITVAVGTSFKLVLQSASADAFGGVAFGSQPVVWVVDSGGNLVSTDHSTQVGTALHPRDGLSLSDASSADILTLPVFQSAFFLDDGVGYLVAVSGSNATVYKWGCEGPVASQTVGAEGSALAVFSFDKVLWMLTAGDTGLEVFAHSGSFALRNSSVPGNMSVVEAIRIGDSQYIAAVVTPANNLSGTVLFSWARPDGATAGSVYDPVLTLVHNVSSGEGVYDLAHCSYKNVDYLFEVTSMGNILYKWEGIPGAFKEIERLPIPGSSHRQIEVFYLASGQPSLVWTLSAFNLAVLQNLESSGSISMLDNIGGSQSLMIGSGPCTVSHAAHGSAHLVALACPQLEVFSGDGTAGSFVELESVASAYSSVAFFLSNGQTYLVALAGSAAASDVWRVEGAGSLGGATLATASAGVVAFTDLAIDLAASYDLAFAPESLYPLHANSKAYGLAWVYDWNLTVNVGVPDGLAKASVIAVGSTPTVVVVDAGGNNLTDTVEVTAVLDGPWNFSVIETLEQISSTGARDAEYFKIGDGHYVAVASNFDGTSFNIDSTVFRFSGGTFSAFQSLETKGAYDLEAFSMTTQQADSAGPINKTVAYFLAVANHYDDALGFRTDSVIYRWNATQAAFAQLQAVRTLGATSWESFEVSGVMHLAVSNFFDGNFHTCNSAVYRWSGMAEQFELLQEIQTVAAHDVAYVEYRGRHYLAFAQYRDRDEISLATTSALYRLDERTMQFAKVLDMASSATMHIEAFHIGSSAFLAVANYANATTGALAVDSTIYELTCTGDTEVLTAVQEIETNGAAHWRYFSRGGNHYLAVCHWVPDDLDANYVVVYLYDAGSFRFYTNTTSLGAFATEFMFAEGAYYLIEAIPGDPVSEVKRFVDAGGGLPLSSTVASTGGRASFSDFDDELAAQPVDGSVLRSLALDVESPGLQSTTLGPYRA